MVILDLVKKVKKAVIKCSTEYSEDQIKAYKNAIKNENNENAVWVLKLLLKNAKVAKKKRRPLCDDTGIPHVYIEIGKKSEISSTFFQKIRRGIAEGLRELPGRPMALKGDDIERIEQSKGIYEDPGKVVPPSFFIDNNKEENGTKIHIMMLGGGPEIRARTKKVFHEHDYRKVFKEVIRWIIVEAKSLGCTPCVPAIGIGRTHYEATSLMLKAIAHGKLDQQSELEKYITNSVNSSGIGPLGLGGSTTALGTLIKIGPQRASGVRIVSTRLCCCVEPRKYTITI